MPPSFWPAKPERACGPVASRTAPEAAPRGDHGFSLLEIMVALAIVVPALTLLYREGALAVATTRTASAYQEAVSRAQSRLNALAATAHAGGQPASGVNEGEDGGNFHWRTAVSVLGTAAPLRSGGGGTRLYAFQVEVSWPGPAGSRRRVVLDTLQLGPVQASRIAAGP